MTSTKPTTPTKKFPIASKIIIIGIISVFILYAVTTFLAVTGTSANQPTYFIVEVILAIIVGVIGLAVIIASIYVIANRKK